MPEDPKTVAEAYFLSSPDVTFRDTAEELDLSYETVRDWGDSGRWYYKRLKRVGGLELPDDIHQQAEIIRAVLVRIIATEKMGADQMAELVEAWKSLVSIGSIQDQGSFDRDALLDALNES